MKATWLTGAVAVVCLAWLGAGAALAAEGGGGKKPALPQAAQDALLKAFPGATISEIERESEDGVKFFSVELEQDGKEIEVEVTAEGAFGEVESVVALESLPAAVQKALGEATKGGKIAHIEKHEIRGRPEAGKFIPVDPPKLVYEAKYTLEGKRKSAAVTVDAAGTASAAKGDKGDREDDDDDDDEEDEDDD
jgi:uncharacterized membrane protein YkoI